jgi:hypothetical protein
MAIVLAADLLEEQLVVLIHDEDVNDAEARSQPKNVAAGDLGQGAVVGVDASNHHRARLGSHRPPARRGTSCRGAG